MFGFGLPLMFPEPPAYEAGAGASYAQTLAQRGQRQSFRLVVLGWVLIVAAGGFALLGTSTRSEYQVVKTRDEVTTLRSTPSNWVSAYAGMIYGACAVVAAAVGWQFLDRATDAALLASAATMALGRLTNADDVGADIKAYELCVEAKAGWLEGRMNHDRIAAMANHFFPDSAKNDGRNGSPANGGR